VGKRTTEERHTVEATESTSATRALSQGAGLRKAPRRDGGPSLDATAQTAESARAAGRAPDEGDVIPQGTVVGRYVVIEKVASGGMGSVYKAYDPQLDRKVAVKVVSMTPSEGTAAADSAARLVREAKSLAQLSHPNVVAVHDVGAYGDDVFIAMAFVEGQTLRAWMRQEKRSHDAIVRVFAEAGRGLAAAHSAGIVHRDFKPDNVLIGDDGRVRVVDFGIALAEEGADVEVPVEERAAAGSSIEAPAFSTSPSLRDAASALGRLTRMGALVGTPAYMSPEQFLNADIDAKSDQFSFCVALYEALFGKRPFSGKDLSELRFNVVTGKVRGLDKAAAAVPARLKRVALRGLAASAADRYESMDELLAQLTKDPRSVARRWAVAAGAVVLGMVALLSMRGGADAPRLCESARTELRGHWDESIRARARAAFAATGKGYAVDLFARASDGMDAYAEAWIAARQQSCEATHVLGTQSDTMLDLRTSCLDRRRDALSALAGVFSGELDAALVDNALTAVAKLPPIDDCADDQALMAAVPPPGDPEVRAQVEALRGRLSEARAFEATGRYQRGLEILGTLEARVNEAGYEPLRAEFEYLRGQLQFGIGKGEEAEVALRAAALLGSRARDDRLVADAWTLLLLAADQQARYDEGLAMYPAAEAAVARAGDEPVQRGVLLESVGALHSSKGNYDTAVTYQEQALAIIESALGENHPKVAMALNDLSNTYYRQARLDEARELDERVLEIRQRVLGDRHPEVAVSLYNLATLAAGDRDYERSESMFAKSLELFRDAHGEEHPHVAAAYHALGSLHRQHRQFDKAVTFASRSLALRERLEGAEHPLTASSLALLGASLVAVGDAPGAEAALTRALAIQEKIQGAEHPDLVYALRHLAEVHAGRGDWARARPLYLRALEIRKRAFGPEHFKVGEAHRYLGAGLLAAGRPRDALGHLERAIELYEQHEKSGIGLVLSLRQLGFCLLSLGRPGQALPVLERARSLRGALRTDGYRDALIDFALARALWASGKDKPRAWRLAVAARATLAEHADGPLGAHLVDADRWLAEHRQAAATLAPTGAATAPAASR